MSSEGQRLSVRTTGQRNQVLSEVFSRLPFFSSRIVLMNLDGPGYLAGSVMESYLCGILKFAIRTLRAHGQDLVPADSLDSDELDEPPSEQEAEEQAIALVVRESASDFSDEDRRRSCAWRRQGPAHEALLLAVTEVWGALQQHVRDTAIPRRAQGVNIMH